MQGIFDKGSSHFAQISFELMFHTLMSSSFWVFCLSVSLITESELENTDVLNSDGVHCLGDNGKLQVLCRIGSQKFTRSCARDM